MPKILITGNGFDLNHGLPTFYKDFITILSNLKNLEEHNFENIYSLSLNYKIIKERYNAFNFDKDNINQLIKLLDNNIWFNFFETELEIESWIDFETKIEYVLKLIFSSVNLLQEKIFRNNPLKIGHGRFDSRLFNNNIEILEVLNFFKIIDWDSSTLILNENYFHQKYNYNIDIDTEKIVMYLNKDILIFKKIFNLYFETFVVPLYSNIKKESINNLFGGIKYHFTFNYTPTFELLYKSFAKTNYLHGKIGDNNNNNNIVLGINDIPDDVVNKIHYIPFTKYFQKLNGNTDFYFLNKITENTLSNYTFFFYGHSLDKSDEDYINEVFDFINNVSTKRTKKIIIIIHNIESKARLLINLINIRGKDDIVKKMRENILKFILADSDELIQELTSKIDTYPSDPIVF